MRHSRAQLERSAQSILDLSTSTSSLFVTPTKNESTDDITRQIPLATSSSGGVLSRQGSDDFMKQSAKLKPVLIQAIEEVVGELETTHEDVAKGAREHIHSS